jgi:sulfite reductase (ferredoxin)
MVRVKIPGGVLTGRQIDRLADLAEAFSNGRAHLTTRQDVQFHFVPMEQVPRMMRLLAEVGLTTREACGHSVRNVTACPLAGFLAEEVFDVLPYALAASRYLIRSPFCQQLARKFKIAFSGCPEDCAATSIHDIGAAARLVEEGGRPRRGFRVVVGGGLGPTPFVAQPLREFVPVEDLLPTLRGILEVFADHGNRKNKTRARLKFVVHRVGIEALRRLVDEAVAGLAPEERAEADLGAYVADSEGTRCSAGVVDGGDVPSPPVPAAIPAESFEGAGAAFRSWRAACVRAHKDPARAIVTVVVPLGDLEAPRLRTLARLVAAYGSDHARVAPQQNLVLPEVLREDLPALHAELAATGLAEPTAGTALDVTACPGADTCALGITSSKGLARALREELSEVARREGLDVLRGVGIKVSGCPNACGRHHVAGIGLHGAAKKVNGRMVPAYQIHLGGREAGGGARIGDALEKVPARRAPGAVAALVRLVRSEAAPGEEFADAAARIPRERVRSALAPFLVSAGDGADLTQDWGREEPFSLEELGTGECAGAGTDAGADPLDPYVVEVGQAGRFMERGLWADALANLNRSQYTLARVVLAALGKAPESDYETTCELRAHVIDRGLMGEAWDAFHARTADLLGTRRPDPAGVRDLHARCGDLAAEARAARAALARRRESAAAEVPG